MWNSFWEHFAIARVFYQRRLETLIEKNLKITINISLKILVNSQKHKDKKLFAKCEATKIREGVQSRHDPAK